MTETTTPSSDNLEAADAAATFDTLKIAHQYQTRLLILADLKASIAMGVVAILVIIVFTRLNLPGDIAEHTIPALTLFLLCEGLAFILALLVITPKTVNETKLQSIEDTPNPLFFGFFTQFSESEYVDYLEGKLKGPESARRMLIKDLYQVGMALRKKYDFLKYAYVFAAAGVVVPLGPAIYVAFIR